MVAALDANFYQQRNQRIGSEFENLKTIYPTSSEIHKKLSEQHQISPSRIRHILSELKKKSPVVPAPIVEEFPDKKIATRTYDQVLSQIRIVQNYKSETSISQDEGSWMPKPDYPDLPIAITWLSDPHFGSLETDYDLLEKHLQTICTTPNMYVAFGGDEIDNFNAGKYPTGIWSDAVTPEDQMIAWADKLTQLNAIHKICAMVWGNHTEFSMMAGINPFSAFFSHVACPLFVDGGGVLNTKVGQFTYRLGLRHTHWGVSKLNITNAPKRMIQFWKHGLDGAFVGHTHTAAGEDYILAGEQKIAVVGGTYKLMDGFSKRWNGDAQPGGFTVLLYPDKKFMQLCRYPEVAQDILMGKIARLGSFAAR